MTPERAKLWTAIFGLFSTIWPFLTPEPARAKAWELALADLGDDELGEAARHVMATQSQQPTPADLRDAAQGKLQWVPVWKRDPWGSIVLQHGAPVSVGRKQVRVKPGEPAPPLLSWGKADDAYANGIEAAPSAPLLPHSSLAKLVDGVAGRMTTPDDAARARRRLPE